MGFGTAAAAVFCLLALFTLYKWVLIVPNQTAVVIERLGKYHDTLLAGFHLVIPWIDRVAYRRTLKENVLDVPAQTCITSDNVSITIDGVLYLRVVDPLKSAYGISDYVLAAVQLAQTSLRSAIGRMPLDKTFEAREQINQEVCEALNQATAGWGVKVLRYEIRDLQPPTSIMQAMERQVKAEREKRASVLQSEGQKQSQINIAEGERASAIARSEGEMQSMINKSNGERQALVNRSEGEKLAQINRAEGEAAQILRVAQATADGLAAVKAQLGGDAAAAAQLRLSEAYIAEFGKLAKETNAVVIPAEMANIGGMVAAMTSMFKPGQGLNAKQPIPVRAAHPGQPVHGALPRSQGQVHQEQGRS